MFMNPEDYEALAFGNVGKYQSTPRNIPEPLNLQQPSSKHVRAEVLIAPLTYAITLRNRASYI
jgi:hypothetical protein